jgi:hypothetical protein
VELPVTGSKANKSKAGIVLLGTAIVVLMLGGCSGRDAEGSEKLAAINAATARAEKAAERAETALAKIEKATLAEADPDATDDAADAVEADVDGPVSTDPDIKS